MWNAIKNDLFDFVATIKEDTSKQVNKVIGSSEDEQDNDAAFEQALTDLRRSFATFDSVSFRSGCFNSSLGFKLFWFVARRQSA